MLRSSALLILLALFSACTRYVVVPPPGGYSREVLVTTGVGHVDATGEWPIYQDQVYPQVRSRAFEDALGDAQSRLLTLVAAHPVRPGVRLGDLMNRDENIFLLTEDLVRDTRNAAPRWDWTQGRVEVDLILPVADLERFVATLPVDYIEPAPQTTVVVQSADMPVDWRPTPAPAPRYLDVPEPGARLAPGETIVYTPEDAQ